MELHVRGRSMPDVFARIALMLFAAAVDPTSVGGSEVREVRAHGSGLPALLRQWLEECLYVHEVEGFACHGIDFVVFDASPGAGGEPLRLHALLRGEPLDPSRHQVKAEIRGVAAEGLTVDADGDGFRAQAMLEL